MLPLLAELAVSIKVHPLYLMYPATLSCAMGFQTIFGKFNIPLKNLSI